MPAKPKQPATQAATPSPAASKRPRYSPHPMMVREKIYEANLEKATGKSLAHWIAVAKQTGETKLRACAARMTKDHGLTSHQAMWVASYATSGEGPMGGGDPESLVDALYSGANAALRPLHERVVDAALALGDDVVVTACKTMVPFYRKHVFAEVSPADGGVEVQMALGDVPVAGRLTTSRGRAPGDRLAHQIVVRSAKDLDAEFRGWLAKAYALGAGKIARATEIEMPADVAKALAASKPATATWAACTPAMRRDFVLWIVSAKQAETRARRVGQAVEKLAAGKKRMY